MLWIPLFLLQVYFIVNGIRAEEKDGAWSWSKFFFALGFAALEFGVLMLPYYAIDPNSRYFAAVLIGSIVIAVLNFVWFIIACRRWRLPDGRTSLEAYYDEHPKEPAKK